MNNSVNLFQLALKARLKAYAPYSGFAVGAAILSTDGRCYAGCNVENISYPCGTCAEQSAVSQMIGGGSANIAEILIVADTAEAITPCGACLQRIKEFAVPETIIHLANLQGIIKSLPFECFLPLAFSNQEVKK